MVHWLNNKLAFLLLCFFAGNFIFAQIGMDPIEYKDYKDPKQFDKFYKRRQIISAWQINKLKTGALVVKLKTNKPIIDALLKAGNKPMAEKKRLERLAMNLNICKSYRYKYNFSKIYFIYSSSTDTLLNGARSGIFLDSNVVVDPKISMSEDFYLIAETDDLYNSSIGFVKEDSARFVSEKGSKSSTEAEIVIKNKYGHQLKKPFPYCSYEIAFIKAIFSEYVIIDATPVLFNVKRVLGSSDKITYRYEGTDLKLGIPFDFTYYVFSRYVTILNDNLKEYYREAPLPPQEKLDLVKPFLY